jgi:hypothetical protein
MPPAMPTTMVVKKAKYSFALTTSFAKAEKDDALSTMDHFYERAYGMLSSKQVREAFSLKGETDKTTELYGMTGLTGLLAFVTLVPHDSSLLED